MIRMCGAPVREPCFAMRPRSSGLARRTARFQEQSLLDDKLLVTCTFLQEKYVTVESARNGGGPIPGDASNRAIGFPSLSCAHHGMWRRRTLVTLYTEVGRSVGRVRNHARTLVGQNRSVSLACRCDETHTHSHGCMGPLGSSVQRGDGGLYKLCTASASAEDVSGSFVDAAFDSPLGILMPKALASRL